MAIIEIGPNRTLKSIRAGLNKAKVGDEVVADDGNYAPPGYLFSSDTGKTVRAKNRGKAVINVPTGSVGVVAPAGAALKDFTFQGFKVINGGIAFQGTLRCSIIENIVEDAPENGIFVGNSESWQVLRNEVSLSANVEARSGITIRFPKVLGNSPLEGQWYGITRGNRIHDNGLTANKKSDGNGIIDDQGIVNDANSDKPLNPKYPRPTLIEDNECWGNAGAGILTIYSFNVTVRSNYCHGNGVRESDSTWRAEYRNQNSWGCHWINNRAEATVPGVTPMVNVNPSKKLPAEAKTNPSDFKGNILSRTTDGPLITGATNLPADDTPTTTFAVTSSPEIVADDIHPGEAFTVTPGGYSISNTPVLLKAQILDSTNVYRALPEAASITGMVFPDPADTVATGVASPKFDADGNATFRVVERFTRPDNTEGVNASAPVLLPPKVEEPEEETLESLRAERDAAISERDSALTALGAAEAERDQALEDLEAAQSERDGAIAERDDLLTQNAQLAADYASLQTQVATLTQQVSLLEGEVNTLQTQLANLSSSRTVYEDAFRAIKAGLDALPAE